MMTNGAEIYETTGLAVDPSGNLYISAETAEGDQINLWELSRSQLPTLNFPTETAPGSTDTTDGTKTVQIQNIGNAPLILTALSYPTDFSEVPGDSSACTSSSNLSAGQQCDLPIEFTPVGFGALSEAVTLTDNALNVAGTTQSIAVTGIAGAPAVLTSPVPGSVLTGSTAIFTWTASPTGSEYFLMLGTTGAGSSNLFNLGYRTVTSWTVTGLPTNGETIYARLYTSFNGTIAYNDYTYTALTTTAATLTSPAPGATLTTRNIPFTWTSVPGATSYNLSLGTTGVGSNNLFNTGYRNVTSWTVTGLPATHETIYARLSTDFNGAIVSADYTFTNGGTAATLTSPSAGNPIGGSVLFTWSPGAGVTKYDLIVGNHGPGSGDFLNSGAITGTSATVNIPAWGGTVYVRLMSEIGGAWHSTDYTFTAQ
jgi:hypothetical protein